jgi:hypothetical protein
MSGTGSSDDCKPYDELGGAYPGELEELYDLEADPGELNNAVQQHPTTRDDLRGEVCTWIQAAEWVDWDEVNDNLLLQQCDAWTAR